MKLAVLISGRGSNLQALIDACKGPAYPARIVLVVSNVAGAPGLDRARAAGIPTAVVDHRQFPSRQAFEEAMDEKIVASGAELVCLAGFMRILTEEFVRRWWDRLINIHPSLLPAFPGIHVHERVLDAGVKLAGCTVHFVRPEADAGPIVVQGAVPVLANDTPATLAARVLEAEHRCYPLAVRLIAKGKARVIDKRVVIGDAAAAGEALINPRPD
jgi:phosphoribosylglycinamide formyltransferase-1